MDNFEENNIIILKYLLFQCLEMLAMSRKINLFLEMQIKIFWTCMGANNN